MGGEGSGDRPRRTPGVCYNVACLYSLEGKVDEAIHCLEEAFERGFGNKEWFENDPDLDPLRAEPRFQSLIERSGS